MKYIPISLVVVASLLSVSRAYGSIFKVTLLVVCINHPRSTSNYEGLG